MATNLDQIKDLLGQGLANEVVANAVGCSPAYITQLLSDEIFMNEIVTLRAANLTANTKRDRSIDSLEDRLIDKFATAVDYMHKPMEILAALTRVNAMKRRGVSSQEATLINQTVVNLEIPVNILQNFVQNNKGEVIEVEGETLVTMPAGQLLRTLEHKSKSNGDEQTSEKYRSAAKFLPGSQAETAANNGASRNAEALRKLTAGLTQKVG